jgi:hypothetical protein
VQVTGHQPTTGKRGIMDLYHRTSPGNARNIMREKSMFTKENKGEAYFSTRRDSEYTDGYGTGVVHIRVPDEWEHARLDDEFPNGEQHFAVKLSEIQAKYFVTEE